MSESLSSGRLSRRRFVQASAFAGSTAVALVRPPAVHAGGDETLRIGLIGCGGRGSGAAADALTAGGNVKLTAMGDVFEDRLELSLNSLSRQEDFRSRIDVPPERRFSGFDAYKGVLQTDVDVVLLATPPHFRPMHLQAAVAAGKHVFAEKPCAVDTPGVHSVLRTCEEAKAKKLAVVSGLCLRYLKPFQQAIARIHDGQIGEVRTLLANDYRGPIWVKPRQSDWTDMHWQMRNWYYFTWLSGDFNVEQHVHNLDICAWAMQDQYPIKAMGMGGREVRKGPEYGNIFDHHSVVYEYENGTRLISNCRQMEGCKGQIGVEVLGGSGTANISERRGGVRITGASPWSYDGEDHNPYHAEHAALFECIRRGEPINDGVYMAKSTLLAIMGRMATYTGQEITWDMAWNSQEDLSPPHYDWGDLPPVVIAVPGKTQVV